MTIKHGKGDQPRGRFYAPRKAKRRKLPKRRQLADWERGDHTRGAGRDLLGVDLD